MGAAPSRPAGAARDGVRAAPLSEGAAREVIENFIAAGVARRRTKARLRELDGLLMQQGAAWAQLQGPGVRVRLQFRTTNGELTRVDQDRVLWVDATNLVLSRARDDRPRADDVFPLQTVFGMRKGSASFALKESARGRRPSVQPSDNCLAVATARAALDLAFEGRQARDDVAEALAAAARTAGAPWSLLGGAPSPLLGPPVRPRMVDVVHAAMTRRRLQEGVQVLKFGSTGNHSSAVLLLLFNRLTLSKSSGEGTTRLSLGSIKGNAPKSMNIDDIVEIIPGLVVSPGRTNRRKSAADASIVGTDDEHKFLSIIGTERVLQVELYTKPQRDALMSALVHYVRFMRNGELLARLEMQKGSGGRQSTYRTGRRMGSPRMSTSSRGSADG